MKFVQKKGFPILEDSLVCSPANRDHARAFYQELPLLKIQNAGGMFIDPQDGGLGWKHGFQPQKAGFSHIAETGVMGSPFGVVPVRDHDQIQTESPEEVQAFGPGKLFPDLVDFVNGQGEFSQRQGGGAGGNEAAFSLKAFQEDLRNSGSMPVFEGIGGASRADEDIVCLAEGLKSSFRIGGRYVPNRSEGSSRNGQVEALLEIFPGFIIEIIGVHLEAGRGIDEGGLDRGRKLFEKKTMNPDHRIRCFPRAHYGDQPVLGHPFPPGPMYRPVKRKAREIKAEDPAKSHRNDGFVKSSR